jgi:hypothetical protein
MLLFTLYLSTVQYTLPSFMDAFRGVQAALESGLERDVE